MSLPAASHANKAADAIARPVRAADGAALRAPSGTRATPVDTTVVAQPVGLTAQTITTLAPQPPAPTPCEASGTPTLIDAATATRAVSSGATLGGRRLFEVKIADAVGLPGARALEQTDYRHLRDDVIAALLQTPEPAGDIMAVRRLAHALATRERMRIVSAGIPDCIAKANVSMKAAIALHRALLDKWETMLRACEHPDALEMSAAPEAWRETFAEDWCAQVFAAIAAKTPLRATPLADYAAALDHARLLECAAALLPVRIDSTPRHLRTDGGAHLQRLYGKHFISRYNQGDDPDLQYPGNGGLCLGLALQWIRDGGHLVKDGAAGVGPARARRIIRMQRATELTRRIVAMPDFSARMSKVRAAVGDGAPGPAWAQIVKQVHRDRGRAIAAGVGNARLHPDARQGDFDFELPGRLLDRGLQEGFRMLFKAADVSEKGDTVYPALQTVLDPVMDAAIARLSGCGKKSHCVVTFQFEATTHAVAVSVQHCPNTGRPRLVFFDPNLGELAFPMATTRRGAGRSGLDNFVDFEPFVGTWLQRMCGERCISVRVDQALIS